ncbi:Porphobilinogen deaminase [Geodia barretti]|uniref:hydroxymethylbilane synthase n=1 Tax=Geodia barretti TaxID=519541 RepID=A0AA35XFX3_GEOBA|nr:Porphobilinogen deaminase [Geodia barretti]
MDKPLPAIGQTNLFTKELETALAGGQIDLIVHSLKDLPTTIAPEMKVAVIFKRDKSTDAVVLHSKHKGKRLQRAPQWKCRGHLVSAKDSTVEENLPGPGLQVCPWNLNTRMKKLDESGEYDALVLPQPDWRDSLADRIDQELDSSE